MKNDLLLGVKKKSVAKKVPVDAPVFSVGDVVLIKRPSMWYGAVGVVEKVIDGLHQVRVKSRDGDTYSNGFRVDAYGDLLEIYI